MGKMNHESMDRAGKGSEGKEDPSQLTQGISPKGPLENREGRLCRVTNPSLLLPLTQVPKWVLSILGKEAGLISTSQFGREDSRTFFSSTSLGEWDTAGEDSGGDLLRSGSRQC